MLGDGSVRGATLEACLAKIQFSAGMSASVLLPMPSFHSFPLGSPSTSMLLPMPLLPSLPSLFSSPSTGVLLPLPLLPSLPSLFSPPPLQETTYS